MLKINLTLLLEKLNIQKKNLIQIQENICLKYDA